MQNAQFREFISKFQDLQTKSKTTSLEEARRLSADFFSHPDQKKEDVSQIHDVNVQGREGNPIKVRLYHPEPGTQLPLLIFYHRGGWVFGSVDESDAVCRKIANRFHCLVASVEYRLAPENPFPKPLYDAYDAFLWLSSHAKELGGDPKSLILCGESAGGNLAVAVALLARDLKGPPIQTQLLIYPAISLKTDDKAFNTVADKYFLTKDSMEFFWSMYLHHRDEKISLEYASLDKVKDLKGLPRTILIIAEHDPLYLEEENFAKRLKKAGVSLIADRIPGVIHGFLDLPIYSDEQVEGWLQRIKKHLFP